MIREVDLVSYLPPFIADFKEISAALDAENPEFTIVWQAANRVLYNEFIATADEYGISRFENLLNILPSREDTLETRRLRVQSQWFNDLPYTLRVLLKKLTVLCNGTDFTLNHNFTEGYTLTLITDLELFGQTEELENILLTMLPCNIVMDVQNRIPCASYGEALVAGGICHADDIFLTEDDIYRNIVNGSLKSANAFVGTAFVTITNDFKEKITISGTQNIGAGLAFSEAISTVKGD